jgi:uncharacterized membrane protein
MRTLYLATVWLHILAAMTWIGGMVVVAGAVMPHVRQLAEPQRSQFLWPFFGRFRAIMWTAFVVVGLTGAVCLGLRGVEFADLLSADWRATPFGSVVSLKIALYVAGGGITLVHERVKSPSGARWLGRLTLGLGVVMVLLAVLLVRGA